MPFEHSADELWFVGDLINRGPKNLETLNFVRDLGSKAQIVLGNHDLHLLAIVFGGHKVLSGDTFEDVIAADESDELAEWLRSLPLLVERDGWVMVHAGIPHVWNLEQARRYASEVEDVMQRGDFKSFFKQMYGNDPSKWDESLAGMDRWRLIINYFTRLRLIAPDGTIDFSHKGKIEDAPRGVQPWFTLQPRLTEKVVFGHWAAIDGLTGSRQFVGTDTGCVWGRGLTAVRLEDQHRFTWIDGKLIKTKSEHIP